MRLNASRGSEQYHATNSRIACSYVRCPLTEVRLFGTAVFASSRSGSARTRFGTFFLRDFDLGIGDGLLAVVTASSNGALRGPGLAGCGLPIRLPTPYSDMTPLRARVQDGRLRLDQPTGLPEGTELDLVIDDEGCAAVRRVANASGQSREIGDIPKARLVAACADLQLTNLCVWEVTDLIREQCANAHIRIRTEDNFGD